MKNWIMNFIADERGAETTEFGVVTTVAAAGSVAGLKGVRSAIQTKNDELEAAIGASDE